MTIERIGEFLKPTTMAAIIADLEDYDNHNDLNEVREGFIVALELNCVVEEAGKYIDEARLNQLMDQ